MMSIRVAKGQIREAVAKELATQLKNKFNVDFHIKEVKQPVAAGSEAEKGIVEGIVLLLDASIVAFPA